MSLNYRWTVHSHYICQTVLLYTYTWQLYRPQSLYTYTWYLYCPQSLYTYTWHVYCPHSLYSYTSQLYFPQSLYTYTSTTHSRCILSTHTCTAHSHRILTSHTCTAPILAPHTSPPTVTLYLYLCCPQSLCTYTWPAEWPSCVGHCLPPHSCTAQNHCSGQA